MLASCALTEVALSLDPHATPDTTGEVGTEKSEMGGYSPPGNEGRKDYR